MSLDVWLTKVEPVEVYEGNITHNLGAMAEWAGLYEALWRPYENGFRYARDLIRPLEVGLEALESDPVGAKKFDSPNGWGKYDNLVAFVKQYLAACREHPDSDIGISR